MLGEKTLTTSFRKCHILQPENSSPNRDSNPHSSIGGSLRSRRANRYTTRHPTGRAYGDGATQIAACYSYYYCTVQLLFVGCLTSQQHTSVSQGRICTDSFTCCHTEIEDADQPFHLTQSQYTDTGPTSPSTDPVTPGAWQGSHWSANFEVTGMTRPPKNPGPSGIRTRDLPLSRRTP